MAAVRSAIHLSPLFKSPEPPLPANYEAIYRRAVTDLDQHLASSDAMAARATIRLLIEKIVVQPGSARGGKRRTIQLHGDLIECSIMSTC